MVKNGKRVCCGMLVLLLILAGHAVGAAALTATLDRDRVVAGETVTLVIQSNDRQQSLDTDLSVLEPDFVILDRRTETQMSIVNGRQSSVTRLLLTLEPRRSGVLRIPPLRFGSAVTPERTLHVQPAPEPEPGELLPVFIDVELDPAEGPYYVHAQLRLTVRVHYLPNLVEAAITPPEPSPAVVRLLDEVPYQADRGGTRFRVLERHYAVFPERSGPLVIPEMRLTGRLVDRRSDQLWQPAVRGRRIQAASEPLELDIRPRPAAYTGEAWQPARALEATQNVSAADTLKVGEPVTRTVIIDAVGLEENMITAPPWGELSDARIYPDRPQGITRDDGRWVLGHKEFRYAVVPEREGELVLPELTVHWWDTVNDRQMETVLPEVRLEILPTAIPAPHVAAGAPAGVAGQPASAGAPPVAVAARNYWVGLAAVFAALWLATLLLYLRGPRGPAVAAARSAEDINPKEREILDDLRRACSRSDAPGARRALAQWQRRYAPAGHAGGLRALAASAGDERLREALLRLDAAGFAPSADAEWRGDTLWERFSAWRANSERQERTPAEVTDLYSSRAR